jgi:hypothetical protein
VINGCSASAVRTGRSEPNDPALLLTNGHCAEERPPRGTGIRDRPSRLSVTVGDVSGNASVRAFTTRLLYATMSGTDVALYRLDRTYAELADAGVPALTLSDEGSRVGDRVTLLSGAWQESFACTIEAIVPTLREGGYEQHDALRYATSAGCEPGPGTSGSPLVDPDTRQVVAIHNTHNDGDGEACGDDNPCEVDPQGATTAVKGRSYAQQTAGLARCIAAGSRVVLTQPGCALE